MEEWGVKRIRTGCALSGIAERNPIARYLWQCLCQTDPVIQKCFISWVEAIREAADGEVIAIDGKTLRRSHNRRLGQGAIHLVSAWARSNRLTLGQVES